MLDALHNWVRRVRAQWATGGQVLPNLLDHLEAREKELVRLWENPPPCGSVIRFAQEYNYGEIHGEFLFKAADVEQAIKTLLNENPRLANGDEGALLHWLQGRDESVSEPSDVPTILSRFKYIADNLIRSEQVQIRCRKCEAVISPDEIVTNDDTGKPSWNFDRLQCPRGHNLLVVENVHIAT